MRAVRCGGAAGAGRGARALAFAVAAALLHGAAPARADGVGWATAQAAELTRQAEVRAAAGEADVALSRYLEAVRFDATYGPAYLGLGALYERAGDPSEAERTYTVALDHVRGFVEGYRARAALRAREGRRDEAIADLEAAVALRGDDAGLLQELAAAYVAAGALPAALGVARRLSALAAQAGDPAREAAARTQARALSVLVGEADPVRAGGADRGPVRRALALYAAAPARGRAADPRRQGR
ncbi:tetratricopeptide repeat protein [Sorangium cellulosum]|uniref:tetratricopeptide repeat protein n=1 Tax=Sorangium cellulosum TaxID=56 RepID=UPI000401341C|nr:tetratricopeptide repeat protein [Sorangium cellulosum]